MSVIETYTSPAEDALTNEFLKNGYIIRPVDNLPALDALRNGVVKIICNHLGISMPGDDKKFLDTIHKEVAVEKLNDMRINVFSKMNSLSWFKPTYFHLAKSIVEAIVGNELVMQNKVNLSVQYPDDKSSLLNVHADTWSDESPFQVVVWLPLVDVSDTKSMYILDPEQNRTVGQKLQGIAKQGGADKLYEEYKDKFKWLEIPYGSVLVFSPNLLHGNVINKTPETRWSMNCRFKGLFAPYLSEEKKLGTFYSPITVKAVSRVGSNYKTPEGFHE